MLEGLDTEARVSGEVRPPPSGNLVGRIGRPGSLGGRLASEGFVAMPGQSRSKAQLLVGCVVNYSLALVQRQYKWRHRPFFYPISVGHGTLKPLSESCPKDSSW